MSSTSVLTYRYDAAHLVELARLTDLACDGADDLLSASARVSALAAKTAPGVDPAAVHQLRNLLAYVLMASPPGSPKPDVRLEPMTGPRGFPCALRDADDQVRALWIGLVGTVTHPVARARCHDVVFTLRLAANVRDSAEQAVIAYLDAVGGSLRSHVLGVGLSRAWNLVRAVGLTHLQDRVDDAMLNLAETVINRGDDPYAAIVVLDALMAPARRNGGNSPRPSKARADALAERGLVAYTGLHEASQFAAMIRARAANDAAWVERANRAEITAMLTAADQATDGLVIRFHLDQASSLARRYGLSDLEQRAVSLLQTAPPVSWATITLPPVTLPQFYVHQFMYPFRRGESWQATLSAWFNTDSPSGRHERNIAMANRTFSQSVISRLATQIRFGHGDMPQRVITGGEYDLQAELVRVESLEIDIRGGLLARALLTIAARFSIPSQTDLVQFIRSKYGTGAPLAGALSTALRLFWTQEYTACVHLAAPKIEAAARALLLELNEPVYRTAIGDSPGQFAGLGALLPYLVDNGLDPDWERFLRTYLLSEGHNVRNLTAHGYLDEATPATAALVLRACALMLLITADDAARRDKTTVKAALARPLTGPLPLPWRRRFTNAARAAWLEMRGPRL